MKWNAEEGHIPRGFCGAFGSLSDIALVLVLAEPGNPPVGQEKYDTNKSPETLIADIASGVFAAIRDRCSPFHSNIQLILDCCWPGLSLLDQLKRTWITESVLCSANVACAKVPESAEQACADTYLRQQLAILPDRYIAGLGRKAQHRMDSTKIKFHFPAAAPGLPGGNDPRSKQSWVDLGRSFRDHIQEHQSEEAAIEEGIRRIEDLASGKVKGIELDEFLKRRG
jgi:hypothetical protein